VSLQFADTIIVNVYAPLVRAWIMLALRYAVDKCR